MSLLLLFPGGASTRPTLVPQPILAVLAQTRGAAILAGGRSIAVPAVTRSGSPRK